MYHEEKIIDGILCWRSTPQGDWIAYTAEQLTEKLTQAKRDFTQEHTKRVDLQNRYDLAYRQGEEAGMSRASCRPGFGDMGG